MKRAIACLLCGLLLIGALTGCAPATAGTPEPTPAPTPEPTPIPEELPPEDLRPELVRVVTAEPASLDPVSITAEGKSCLLEVYEPLFTTETRGGAMTAILADASRGALGGYDHEAGTAVYTVYLLPGLKDHAGNALTAVDAAFCYGRMAESAAWSVWKSAEALDDTQLQLTFSRELTGPGELHERLCDIYLYTEKAFTDNEGLAAAACGTGPYTLALYEPGVSMALLEWGGYRTAAAERARRAQANVARIEYLFVAGAAQRVIALETGRADMADCLTYADTVDFRGEGVYADSFRVEQGWSDMNYVLIPNTHKYSRGNSETIRNALFYAIDLEKLADCFGEGGARPCTAPCNPDYPDVLAAWETAETYQNSVKPVDEIRTMLRKVQYVNESITILALEDSVGEELACAIQTMLRPLSITIYVLPQTREEFDKTLTSKSAWDFAVMPVEADDCAAEVWKTLWTDTMQANGTVTGFFRDANFVKLLQAADSVAECTPENIAALMDFVFAEPLAMGLVQPCVPVVVAEWTQEVCLTARGELLPGACVY